MITARDLDYHPHDPSATNWAETLVCVFSVPEAGILGNAYVLVRPEVGAAISSVVVHGGFATHAHDMDFVDPQVHMPAPERFSDFTLPSGLSLHADPAPRDFSVQYESNTPGACSLDLRFAAIADPFDTHDPAQNPLVVPDGAMDTGLGDVWANGHMDAVGRVTGELVLRGQRYAVDCVEGMDRSWGPRTEVGTAAAAWIHVTLGPEFALHVAMAMSIDDAGAVHYDGMRFGYVVEDGELHGLTDASVEAARVDMVPVSNHIMATDVRGRRYEFHGSAVGGYPWHQFSPAYVCYQSLMRYESDGRVGYAEHGDVFGIEYLAARRSAAGRRARTA
ncbi:hypothetical protein [Curtobacterium sp. MCBD17_040]|uniref:DUF7064 domain-containing protein n=1 Tax=Curtobacterium sp. MCBD17_040 TaxID=2175674 RepID=UPI000DA6FD3E|nr:hypothetical protein [Curtobacterium sp. MCBD17_040]WIB63343.1 hypothetical protein DEI94_14530 [Curtobacterium sp. MCBD17_040]